MHDQRPASASHCDSCGSCFNIVRQRYIDSVAVVLRAVYIEYYNRYRYRYRYRYPVSVFLESNVKSSGHHRTLKVIYIWHRWPAPVTNLSLSVVLIIARLTVRLTRPSNLPR